MRIKYKVFLKIIIPWGWDHLVVSTFRDQDIPSLPYIWTFCHWILGVVAVVRISQPNNVVENAMLYSWLD